jgi:hypothetical protein
MSTQEIRLEQEYEASMDAAGHYHYLEQNDGVLTALNEAQAIGNELNPPRNAEAELEERVNTHGNSPLHRELAAREDDATNELRSRGRADYQSTNYDYAVAKDSAQILHKVEEMEHEAELTKAAINNGTATAIEVQREYGIYRENHEHDVYKSKADVEKGDIER